MVKGRVKGLVLSTPVPKVPFISADLFECVAPNGAPSRFVERRSNFVAHGRLLTRLISKLIRGADLGNTFNPTRQQTSTATVTSFAERFWPKLCHSILRRN